jgi:hypothetical protein
MDVLADVALLGEKRFSGVEADPEPDLRRCEFLRDRPGSL